MSLNPVEKAVLKTLKYRGIFNYPLTIREIYEYLITDELKKTVPKEEFQNAINSLITKNLVKRVNGYYCCGCDDFSDLIHRRKKREAVSRARYREIKKMLDIFSKIDLIRFIGVSGAVAAGNADEKSDINLFVIAKTNSVWTARFWTSMYTKFKPKAKHVKFNIFVSSSNLEWGDKNIYTAHEILLLKPLFNKGAVYEKFIQKNLWVFDYFSNYPFEKVSMDFRVKKDRSKAEDESGLRTFSVNKILMKQQLKSLEKGKINGIFSNDLIHIKMPDHKKEVLKKWYKATF